jgi:hypothetical protein
MESQKLRRVVVALMIASCRIRRASHFMGRRCSRWRLGGEATAGGGRFSLWTVAVAFSSVIVDVDFSGEVSSVIMGVVFSGAADMTAGASCQGDVGGRFAVV